MRSRSISFYSFEDLTNQTSQTSKQLDTIEENGLSSKASYSPVSCSRLNFSTTHRGSDDDDDDDEEEEDEEENELRERNDLILLNKIYHSERSLMNNELTSSETKIICKCLKDSIVTNTQLFYQRPKSKRNQTINSLKDLELKKFIHLMFKTKPSSDTQNNSLQNYVKQNLEGEHEMKLLILSNSTEEKNKIMSQLLSNNEECNSEDEESDGLGCPKTPLNIMKKKYIYQNKAIDLEIFDTHSNFYKHTTSTIYYKIAKVFLVIVDNEKCLTPLAFTQIVHGQYKQHSTGDQRLIIIDVNSNPNQKNIETYCKKHGVIYIRLDKNYSSLPEALTTFLFLFTNQKPKKEDNVDWIISDSLKRGFEYNIDEAFLEASPKRNTNKRATSLLITK